MKKLIYQGVCAYPGRIKGRIKKFSPKKKYSKKDIVLTKQFPSEVAITARQAGGFIANKGSLTCHAAILVRELKKPCLVKVNIKPGIKEGQKIILNATKGEFICEQ